MKALNCMGVNQMKVGEKLKRSIVVVISVVGMSLTTVGCRGIQRLTTGSDSPMPQQSVPARSEVTGVLAGERECVSVAGMDLGNGVTVLINDSLTLNQYEFELRPIVGQVCFKNQVIIQPNGNLLIPGGAATHAGDHYRITEVSK